MILDTPASDGGIHSPYKEAAGTRLARASLVHAYGRKDISPGPVLGSVSTRTTAGTVTVSIQNPSQGVALHTDGRLGFEALPYEAVPYSVRWTNVPIVFHTAGTARIEHVGKSQSYMV